jgi:hypothetical protein
MNGCKPDAAEVTPNLIEDLDEDRHHRRAGTLLSRIPE